MTVFGRLTIREKRALLGGLCLLLAAVACLAGGGPTAASAPGGDYYRIVVFADPHLPGNNLAAKQAVLGDVNSWPDVGLVAVVGDICAVRGTPDEYAAARDYFQRLKKPLAVVAGNHDYIYGDTVSPRYGSAAAREAKLGRFRDTFGLAEVYYTRQAGPYLLVFLSPDDLATDNLTALSARQLAWLRATLATGRLTPTIVFFHGPLEGTYSGRNRTVGNAKFCAQPAAELDRILADNPQVFMWVAGHIHIAPGHASFSGEENVYAGRVATVHNPALAGTGYLSEQDKKGGAYGGLWTNSLYLYPDKVVVRTYDHTRQTWLAGYDREIARPALPAAK